ncbi:MAG: septum formation initiator family protein [Clostridia bacterium]|nr:septum formation initiator family protein [Clostridia bacterium]
MENYKQTKRFENFVRLSVLLLVVLVCVATFSFARLGKVKRQNEKYDNLIAELTAENEKIQQSIIDSQDPLYLENQVRDNLGKIKGDEKYIEFQK